MRYMEPTFHNFHILDPHIANILFWKIDSFETLQLLSPGEKCRTNYLRRGSVISVYGPCGHFGCGSLFKTIVKCRTNRIFLSGQIVLNCVSYCLLYCLLALLFPCGVNRPCYSLVKSIGHWGQWRTAPPPPPLPPPEPNQAHPLALSDVT